MVLRIFVEKKKGLDNEARRVCRDIGEILGIAAVREVRIFNRYDVEGLSEELFRQAVRTVFSEPQLDRVSEELPASDRCFAVEYLPGQFDQRAESAAECVQMISRAERPAVRTARVYALYGDISDEEFAIIKSYYINGVEAREASPELPATLAVDYEIPVEVETIEGFTAMDEEALERFLESRGLAMDLADLRFCRQYFRGEERDPTISEIRMIDTYWSDHCRHTTFLTAIDGISFEDEKPRKAYDRYLRTREYLDRGKPVSLMDIGTLAAKYLRREGRLSGLDESEEINACTVKIKVDHDGKDEDWLLLFKNETHNHPTEIEPFGGAATCIGGAIRDPLSGRGYVYAAMRVTGAGDPLADVADTIPGKLPQRTLVTTAAEGYSSYGNQIGLATGQVEEIYHPGYVAKRMEVGAVIAAAPAENVVRKTPAPGDRVILLGGRTGRDGCGGATGSSKSHNLRSLEECGAEVQKGNAPEERKLQRLFRNPEASRMIKRCNDFGAGGVSVAIGELAEGLDIDLNRVPRKYDGLDGTELAISESQERMAVVVDRDDAAKFIKLAEGENLEATVVAEVTDSGRLRQYWNGRPIIDIARSFLDSNGAEKHIRARTGRAADYRRPPAHGFNAGMKALAGDLNVCSGRGLAERFDSTIGAGTVLMPFGGIYQRTPVQAMVNKIPVEKWDTSTVSLMAYGYNPYISEKDPYDGAYLAVVESVSKLIAAGAANRDIYLTFQEYFEKLGRDEDKWGVPVSSLLGAFSAQMDMGIAAIGGKDSMSGTFEDIHVPPTLISFAVTTDEIDNIISPEFKEKDSYVYIFDPPVDGNGLPDGRRLKEFHDGITALMRSGRVRAAYTPGYGGIAEAVLKMAMGNRIGFRFEADITADEIFAYDYGAFILETSGPVDGRLLGRTTEEYELAWRGDSIAMAEIEKIYEDKLEKVYPCNIEGGETEIHTVSRGSAKISAPAVRAARPRVLIPVFPGTNCEYDSAKAFERAGAEPEVFVINNLSAGKVAASVEAAADKINRSQMIFIPGGFSGGDEPDGSGKFITAFFRNEEVKEAVTALLEKHDGLMAGICNGFQALIKLGLVPFGRITDTDADCPTLTYNRIGRHQSKLVRIRVASGLSPWMSGTEIGDIYTQPISHGEGRFLASGELIAALEAKGQIVTQYVDMRGEASGDIQFNPNGSALAIEGICSPDGRVLGKMGHAERIGRGLYRNVPGRYDMKMFESAVAYFKG